MFDILFPPDYSVPVSLLLLRLALGFIFVSHGIPKMRHTARFSHEMGWPPFLVYALGTAETVGGAALLIGFLTHLAALGLAIIMLGALFHKIILWKTPFTAKNTPSWEFDALLFAGLFALLTFGPGVWSIDAYAFMAN